MQVDLLSWWVTKFNISIKCVLTDFRPAGAICTLLYYTFLFPCGACQNLGTVHKSFSDAVRMRYGWLTIRLAGVLELEWPFPEPELSQRNRAYMLHVPSIICWCFFVAFLSNHYSSVIIFLIKRKIWYTLVKIMTQQKYIKKNLLFKMIQILFMWKKHKQFCEPWLNGYNIFAFYFV